MPTYSFRCKKCGNEFDEFVSINARDKVTCPKCKSKDLTQLITGCTIKGKSSCANCTSTSCSTCSLSRSISSSVAK